MAANGQDGLVSSEIESSFQRTATWLAKYVGFPWYRLPERAELLLWLAAAQQNDEEEASAKATKLFERRVGSQTSALKAHALRRSQVHFKCDNSAKV